MVSVSSKRRTTFPSYILAYSELITTPLECPSVRGPFGFGANLRITLEVSPGSSFRPSTLRCFSRSRASGAVLSSSFLTCSMPRLSARELAAATSVSIRSWSCFALRRRSSRSESSRPSTLPACPCPAYSTAFCSAYLRTAATISGSQPPESAMIPGDTAEKQHFTLRVLTTRRAMIGGPKNRPRPSLEQAHCESPSRHLIPSTSSI